ncbi:hypothetical protein Tco_0609495 [Tanacetum coccineum]
MVVTQVTGSAWHMKKATTMGEERNVGLPYRCSTCKAIQTTVKRAYLWHLADSLCPKKRIVQLWLGIGLYPDDRLKKKAMCALPFLERSIPFQLLRGSFRFLSTQVREPNEFISHWGWFKERSEVVQDPFNQVLLSKEISKPERMNEIEAMYPRETENRLLKILTKALIDFQRRKPLILLEGLPCMLNPSLISSPSSFPLTKHETPILAPPTCFQSSLLFFAYANSVESTSPVPLESHPSSSFTYNLFYLADEGGFSLSGCFERAFHLMNRKGKGCPTLAEVCLGEMHSELASSPLRHNYRQREQVSLALSY